MKNTLAILSSALVLSSSAFAATYTLHVAGSSAFRAADENAIVRNLGTPTAAYLGSSLAGATQATFQGTYGGNNLIVECAWTGSASGVQTVATGANVSLIVNGAATTTAVWISASTNTFSACAIGATGPTGGNALTVAGATYDGASAADFAFSDVFQNTTVFKGPGTVALTDKQVGVVPFTWVCNAPTPAGVTNMTPYLAQNLFPNGQLGLAQWTGNATDEATLILPTGRDADSGTRLSAMTEGKVGAQTALGQLAPTNAAGNVIGTSVGGVTQTGPITALPFFPAQTINGINYAAGDTGYFSGGQLKSGMLAADGAHTDGSGPAYLITYLGENDAKGALTTAPMCRALSWNGVMFYNGDGSSLPYNRTYVIEGSYSFWGYEHELYPASWTNAAPNGGANLAFVTSLATSLKGQDGSISGVLLSAMHASRGGDGQLVSPSTY